ncbi:MAG: hypothetical protein WD270_05580 [Acetobacterales bacterium]
MPYTNSELMRFVHRLIDRYGDAAADQAMLHAEHLEQAGDHDGYAVWMRARRLILELSRQAA